MHTLPQQPQTPTIREALQHTRHTLAAAGIEEAPLEAQVLLAHVTGLSRARLLALRRPEGPVLSGAEGLASDEQKLTEPQANLLRTLLERRLVREPLAYLLGQQEFYGLPFTVRPGVLIPRPETELLVEQVLSRAEGLALSGAEGSRSSSPAEYVLADVGTGCGAIAICLALHLPQARVYATESSAQAMAVARENLQRHHLQQRVTLLLGDLLEPLPEPVDLIVANLPYVRSAELPHLQPEVQHEPPQALDGGPDGLRVIQRLLLQVPTHLKPGGALVLEMDPRQAPRLTSLATRLFPGARVHLERDLAGHDRALVIQT